MDESAIEMVFRRLRESRDREKALEKRVQSLECMAEAMSSGPGHACDCEKFHILY